MSLSSYTPNLLYYIKYLSISEYLSPEQSCEAGANKIRRSIRAATESALKDAKDISEAMDGWGLGAGELHKMPIEQKLELAKRLQTRKFKLMAQVIGRMRRLAVHKQKTKLNHSRMRFTM